MLYACAEDMITLWNDPTIKAMLRSQGIRLEDLPGLCVSRRCRRGALGLTSFPASSTLLSVLRIRDTSLRTVRTAPEEFFCLLTSSADDILRARLKTMGVSEHRFTVKEGESGPRCPWSISHQIG